MCNCLCVHTLETFYISYEIKNNGKKRFHANLGPYGIPSEKAFDLSRANVQLTQTDFSYNA